MIGQIPGHRQPVPCLPVLAVDEEDRRGSSIRPDLRHERVLDPPLLGVEEDRRKAQRDGGRRHLDRGVRRGDGSAIPGVTEETHGDERPLRMAGPRIGHGAAVVGRDAAQDLGDLAGVEGPHLAAMARARVEIGHVEPQAVEKDPAIQRIHHAHAHVPDKIVRGGERSRGQHQMRREHGRGRRRGGHGSRGARRRQQRERERDGWQKPR